MTELKKYNRHHRDDEWSQEELNKLKELYSHPNKTVEEIASQLPRRTQNAIRLKAYRLKLHRPIPSLPGFCPTCGQPLKEEKS
jgi:hypothetical protein